MRFSRTVVVLSAACVLWLCLSPAVRADGESVKVRNTKEFAPPPPPPELAPEVALAPPDYLFPLPPSPERTEVTPRVTPTIGPGGEPVAEPTAARKELRSLQVVPSEAVAVLWLTDLGRTRTLLTDCALGKLAAEPGVRGLLEKVAGSLETPAPGGPSFAFLVRAADLAGYLSNDAALALLKGKNGVEVLIVAAVDDEKRLAVADAARAFAVALAGASGSATGAAGAAGAAVAVREKIVAGLPLSEVRGKDVVVYHGFVENLHVFATGLRGAEAAVKLATADGAGSFEGSAVRRECVKTLAGRTEADLYFSMDLDRLLSAAQPAAAGQVKPILMKLFGKESAKLGTVHYALTVDGARVHERAAVRGVLAGMSGLAREPVTKDSVFLRYIPPDALYFQADNADLETVVGMTKGIPGKGLDFLLGGAKIEKNAILASFSGRLGVGVFVSRTGGMDLLIVAGVKDPKALQAILRPLHARKGITEIEKFMGETIRSVPAARKGGASRALPGRGAGGLPGMASGLVGGPRAYCVTRDKVLVVAWSVDALRKSLRNASQRRRNVLALPHVKEAMRGLLVEEASSVGYFDTERSVELLYAAADSPVFGMLLGGRGAAALPLLDEILPHLSGTAWTSRRTADSVLIDVYSPTGIMPATVMGAVAILPLFSSEETASSGHSVHEGRLRLIWRGLQNYATDHGRFPKNIEDLHPDYVRFSTPAARLSEEEEKAILLQYRVVAGRRPNDHDTAPLVYTSDPVGARYVVLLVNGRAVAVSVENLKPFVRGEIDLDDALAVAKAHR